MLRCTTARVGAVQIWPEWKAQVEPMAVTTPLMSASSKTTAAPLPPSSMSIRFMVGAPGRGDALADGGRAGEGDHVDVGRGGEGGGRLGALAELMRLTTPGGNPTSSRTRASSMTASGSWGAGFMTTVLPMARAGATLPAMLVRGKL